MKISGYAATKPRSQLSQHDYEDTVGADDVAVEITHCGICHSDIHLIDGEMPMGDFPFIPGHEIAGRVTATGDNVTRLARGDRVGVGWQCNSCKTCEWCTKGEQHNCPEQQATCVGRNGGYADSIVVDKDFAFHLPSGLDSHDAAPMMCGGITVYTPLTEHARPGDHVAITGLGGLGHFGVLFADAMGLETTVISTSPDKEEDAHSLGADHFIHTDSLDDAQNTFDLTVNTAPADLDWDAHLAALRPKGTFAQVGATPGSIEFQPFGLFPQDKKIVGSHIGSPEQIRSMLRFAATNNVEAMTEPYDMADVNEALDHVRAGDATYRVVLQYD